MLHHPPYCFFLFGDVSIRSALFVSILGYGFSNYFMYIGYIYICIYESYFCFRFRFILNCFLLMRLIRNFFSWTSLDSGIVSSLLCGVC